jgi:hypothetical protein
MGPRRCDNGAPERRAAGDRRSSPLLYPLPTHTSNARPYRQDFAASWMRGAGKDDDKGLREWFVYLPAL